MQCSVRRWRIWENERSQWKKTRNWLLSLKSPLVVTTIIIFCLFRADLFPSHALFEQKANDICVFRLFTLSKCLGDGKRLTSRDKCCLAAPYNQFDLVCCPVFLLNRWTPNCDIFADSLVSFWASKIYSRLTRWSVFGIQINLLHRICAVRRPYWSLRAAKTSRVCALRCKGRQEHLIPAGSNWIHHKRWAICKLLWTFSSAVCIVSEKQSTFSRFIRTFYRHNTVLCGSKAMTKKMINKVILRLMDSISAGLGINSSMWHDG